MNLSKKRILLKLSGQVLADQTTGQMSVTLLIALIEQIKTLKSTHLFAIVIGGGNLFRGDQQGKKLGITSFVGHQVGMLATMINGVLIKDLCQQHGLTARHLCALSCPEIATSITSQAIQDALTQECMLIFTGGTGNPFFTTDTTAILRALQIEADQVWKGTNVDGIYTTDPHKDPHAHHLQRVSYNNALIQNLGVMDTTAYALAQKHAITIRVFNIFTPNALLLAAQQDHFGSTISKDI